MLKRLSQAVRVLTGPGSTLLEVETIVAQLNRLLVGWANYFRLHIGPLSRAYDIVDALVQRRIRQWLCRKHGQHGSGERRYPDHYLYERLQLMRLRLLRPGRANAKA